MALKTQGFALSQMPRSPTVPNNIGQVDVKAIYDGVRQGLDSFEAVRRAPASMLLADETAATGIDQQQAERQVLPTKTAAVLADTPNRSSVLAGQAQVAARGVPLALAEIGGQEQAMKRLQDAQAKATTEFANFTEDYAKAKNLADYATSADDLEALSVKYPWLDTVPEYKGIAANVKTAATTARTAAQKEADRLAAQTRAETVAAGGVDRAKAAANASAKSGDAAVLRLLIDEGFDDETINNFINKKSATAPSDPNADRASREKVAQARITAQAGAQQANRDLKLNLVNAQHQQKLSHALGALESLESNTAHVDELIDQAIAATNDRSAGYGALLSGVYKTDARALRGLLDSIRSNVGFDALASMRQNSPTGGALGAVSDTENKLLQSTIENLDQGVDPPILRERLESVRQQRKKSVENLKNTYDRDVDAFSSIRSGSPNTGASSPRTFASEAEAEAAAASGDIKTGDTIIVNGVSGRWK